MIINKGMDFINELMDCLFKYVPDPYTCSVLLRVNAYFTEVHKNRNNYKVLFHPLIRQPNGCLNDHLDITRFNQKHINYMIFTLIIGDVSGWHLRNFIDFSIRHDSLPYFKKAIELYKQYWSLDQHESFDLYTRKTKFYFCIYDGYANDVIYSRKCSKNVLNYCRETYPIYD